MYKHVLILLVILFSIGSVSALGEYNVEFGQEEEVMIQEMCNPDTQDCATHADDLTLNACEDSVPVDVDYIDQLGVYQYEVSGQLVPEMFRCSYGEHDISMSGGGYYRFGTLEVEERGYMDPHSANYLYINMQYNEDSPSVAYDLYLSDDEWDRTDNNPDTALMVKQVNSGFDDDLAIPVEEGVSVDGLSDPPSELDPERLCEEEEVCDLLDQRFTSLQGESYGVYPDYHQSPRLDTETVSPIHRGYYPAGANYQSEGDIIVGKQPEYWQVTYEYDGDRIVGATADRIYEGEKKFYICRPGATMDAGEVEDTQLGATVADLETSQVVEADDQLYKCDTEDKSWEQIGECQSGIDHDGDYGIDYVNPYDHEAVLDDTDCDDSTDPYEEDVELCPPSIASTGYGADVDKVAKYDGEWQDGECEYETDEEIMTGEPEVFTCLADDQANEDSLILTDEQIEYCNQEIPDSEFGAHHPVEGESADQMPVVEYYVPRDAIPLTEDNNEAARQFVRDSGDGVEGGFTNKKYQTLQEAMERYYEDKILETSYIEDEENEDEYRIEEHEEDPRVDQTGGSGSFIYTTNEHHPQSYRELNIGGEDCYPGVSCLEGYEAYDRDEEIDPADYHTTWKYQDGDGKLANGTARHNDDIETLDDEDLLHNDDLEGTVDEDEIFPGGFAPKCEDEETMQWRHGEYHHGSSVYDRWLCTGYTGEDMTIHATFYEIPVDEQDVREDYAGFHINWTEMQKWEDAHPYAPPQGTEDVNPVQLNAQCYAGAMGPDRRPDVTEMVNMSATVQEGEDTFLIAELPDRSETYTSGEQEVSADLSSYTCVFGFTQRLENHDTLPHETVATFYDGEPRDEFYSTGYLAEGSQRQGKISIATETRRPTDGFVRDWLEQRAAHNQDNVQILSSGTEPWPHHPTGESDDDEEVPPRHPVTECIFRDRC